jgi:hypothetical protein
VIILREGGLKYSSDVGEAEGSIGSGRSIFRVIEERPPFLDSQLNLPRNYITIWNGSFMLRLGLHNPQEIFASSLP